MSRKAIATALALIAGAAAIIVPIVLSLQWTKRESLDVEKARALDYARDVLHRSNKTADQIYRGIEKLVNNRAADACSEGNMLLMRDIDISLSYIQAIGHVSGNYLLCSSLGNHGKGLPLGPADVVTRTGSSVRNHVRLPFAPGTEFIVIERQGYAAIIHKTHPIDVSAAEKDLSLATFTPDNRQIRTSRGHINPDWLNLSQIGNETTSYDGEYVVAVVESKQYASGAVAALPVSYLDTRAREMAMVLVPLGLVAGLALALAVLFLAKQQLSMPAVIRTALKRNEFFLVYQPVVDLRTGRWVGAEALIRWRRPSGEMVRPDLFIAVAEEAGLIQRITRRVLEIVERDAWDLFQRFPDFHLAINFAPADLQSQESVDLINGLAQRLKARPDNFIIEATERGLMKPEAAREVMKRMREGGMRVAIDDFGTGYSSLSYLESFELDYLKIDKSFVDTIGSEAATSHVIPHIIEMAKSLKLEMVAEAIETEPQAQYLQERGVQFGQGWLYAKPMPMDELIEQLAQRQT